jgi:hypothetical protein
MWTYAQAWQRAADALGVEIEGPLQVKIDDGFVIDAGLLVKQFGAPVGTLVTPTTEQWWGRFEQLRALGLTASSFGPYDDGEEANVEDVMDVLSDWGWCGEGPAPSWLKSSPWS